VLIGLAIIAIIFGLIAFLLLGQQITERKTITATIVRIDAAGMVQANYVASYQITFNDGSFIVTCSTDTVEHSLKEGHTYTISLVKRWGNLLWFITNVTEVQVP
jgi:hypothetical protein